MSVKNTVAPTIGVKALKEYSKVHTTSETDLNLGQTVRMFLNHPQTKSAYGRYCSDTSPAYSLKADNSVDFAAFKASKPAQDIMNQGAEILSATMMDKVRAKYPDFDETLAGK